MIENSDDDINSALAAFSAPSIDYRNGPFRPSTSGGPERTDPATGMFRLLVSALPEAAGLAVCHSPSLITPARAAVEALPEQAPPPKGPKEYERQSRTQASVFKPKSTATSPARVGPKFQVPFETLPTLGTNLTAGMPHHRTLPHRLPDSDSNMTPLAAVFGALGAARLLSDNSIEAEQKLRDVFGSL